VPVNQEDMLATLLTFTEVVINGLRRAGVPVTEAEGAAYFHAWSIAGHLLGVRPDLLPITPADSPRLWSAIGARQFAPSPEGAEMTAALIRLLQGHLPSWLQQLPAAQIRYFVGDDVADMLGVGRGGAVGVLFDPLRRAMSLLALGEQHSRVMRALSLRLGRAALQSFVESDRGTRGAFVIPTHLADRWRVPPGLGSSGLR
jgi:hypothetical protein